MNSVETNQDHMDTDLKPAAEMYLIGSMESEETQWWADYYIESLLL